MERLDQGLHHYIAVRKINGKLCGKINPNRGNKQRDPNNPFISVIDMDYLSCILKHLEISNKIKRDFHKIHKSHTSSFCR